MSSPTISIILATYNGGRYLREQIDSILAQTLKPVEIIVCDDRSADSTIAILDEYSKQGTLTYYINDSQLGVVENFKRAASLAGQSDFYAFADQDDVWLPHKLETLVQAAKSTDDGKPAMVFSDLMTINKQGEVLSKSLWQDFTIAPHKQTFLTLLTRNIATGCTMLINRKMRDEFLKAPPAVYMHDAWITFVAFAFKNYAFVNEPLIQHRNHDGNVLHREGIQPPSGFFPKIMEYVTGFVSNRALLEDEFAMAKSFYNMYKEYMQPKDLIIFEEFLALEDKNFLAKKKHIRYVNKIEHP